MVRTNEQINTSHLAPPVVDMYIFYYDYFETKGLVFWAQGLVTQINQPKEKACEFLQCECRCRADRPSSLLVRVHGIPSERGTAGLGPCRASMDLQTKRAAVSRIRLLFLQCVSCTVWGYHSTLGLIIGMLLGCRNVVGGW